MNMIKLQSGSFVQTDTTSSSESSVDQNLSQIDKKALLVYCGKFDSMDGPVEIKDEHIEKMASERNSFLAKVARMASGETPLKHCPPIQVDHSTSGWDTVGRLVGNLEVGEHTNDEGKKVKALYGTLRVLGKENVERVMDGRWTHLSIGADLETGKFSELTITPFPAAPQASMLSKAKMAIVKQGKIEDLTWEIEKKKNSFSNVEFYTGAIYQNGYKKADIEMHPDPALVEKEILKSCQKFLSKGENMFEKLMKFLTGHKKLAEGEAVKEMAKMTDEEKAKMAAEAEETEKKEKLKKHLMDKEKLSAEDAEKKLGEMEDEDKAKLEAECDEEMKKMAAEEEKKKLADEEVKKAQMKSTKEKLTKLSSDMRASFDGAQLTAKKAKISVRLSKLQSEAKITPAEVKKMDLAAMAKEDQKTIDAVLKTYESREPVIMTGAIGSTHGVNPGSVYKDAKLSKMRADILQSMPFTKMALGLEGKEEEGAQDTVNIHVDTDPHTDLAAAHKLADEHHSKAVMAMDSGKLDEAKEHMKKLMDHCKKYMGGEPAAPVSMENTEAEMSALAQNVERLQNQYNELLQLVGQAVGE